MDSAINWLICLFFLTLAYCRNDTSIERIELLEFPELEIGRVRRNTNFYAEKGVYCAEFRHNFDYYCTGVWSTEKLRRISHHFERIKIFCPTYKRHCIEYKRKTKNATKRRKHIRKDQDSIEDDLRGKSYEAILKELSEIVPCTPECNPNMHPHCTQECKCDYDYPRMQRFCNPPALPLFLNVCRTFHQCSCCLA